MIAHQGERIEATKADMELAISRFKSEIEIREGRIKKLRELRAQYEKGGDDRTGPSAVTPPRAEGEIELQTVKGIGPVGEERLRAGGITTLKALSESPPAKIAEILDVSEERAATFVSEAKTLLNQ